MSDLTLAEALRQMDVLVKDRECYVDHANSLRREHDRLRDENLRLSVFARAAGGQDGYLLSQIASFFGGTMDNANINAEARAIGEEYFQKLLELRDMNRAVLISADGEAK